MSTDTPNAGPPAFYTVREAARILRVDPATLYRAIREDAFPAVRVRTRYVVPAAALHQLVTEAAQSGGCVDVARLAAERRTAREIERLSGVAPWRPTTTTPRSTRPWPLSSTGSNRFRPTVVLRRGLCLWGLWPAQEPDWEGCAPSDRALAQRLCEGCPVIDQCLELDLRTAGASTTGVWGALAEDDRRALHRVWQQRRQQQSHSDQEGGATP